MNTTYSIEREVYVDILDGTAASWKTAYTGSEVDAEVIALIAYESGDDFEDLSDDEK